MNDPAIITALGAFFAGLGTFITGFSAFMAIKKKSLSYPQPR